MPFCETCGGWCFSKAEHQCPDKWLVRPAGWEGCDARTVFATSAEGAAKKYAEVDDRESNDYLVANGGTLELMIRKLDSESYEWSRWKVTAEPCVKYNASHIVTWSWL
jgi:hypothetical protein